jgi:hypothetical protein
LIALTALLLLAPAALAQEPPKPGPEHQRLKELEGTWDAIIKMQNTESKGKVVYKMDVGGLWLTSDFEGAMGEEKFTGKGLDSYDPVRKKYVSVWVDSWSTSPMVSEGTYDKDGKTVTMTGEGPGHDGKPAKYKMTTVHKDKDNMHWTLFGTGPDGKEGPMLEITYKRRK